MVFNRGNKLIKADLFCNAAHLENVKTFKYLGITVSAKKCSFLPTIDDLSIKANRAIFALNNKIKISQIPTKLALKIFNTQIVPILLYGAEVWGPYMDYDYVKWDKTKIERTQTIMQLWYKQQYDEGRSWCEAFNCPSDKEGDIICR